MTEDNDDVQLRRIVIEKRRSGELPRASTPHAWAGKGSGKSCALCEFPINAGEVEYEVEWHHQERRQLLRFHELCYRLWTTA